jgi:putative flippase GtrA
MPLMSRWITFNAVGAIGFAVQLLLLAGLMRLRLHYLVATVMAVEAAVLQNFAWHERWTWRDRDVGGAGSVARLWRFHALNGLVSLLGNLAMMRSLVGELGMPAMPANLVAVLVCSTVNFALGDRFVWVTAGSQDPAYPD